MDMDQLWAGIDLGQEQVSLCVTDALGKILLEQDLEADPQSIFDALQGVPTDRLALIGVEAGTSGHIPRRLRAFGLPVVVLEARKASKVLKLRRNKTDRNDARGLADIVRLGRHAVPNVHEKSAESRRLRMQLSLRQQLIKQRVAGEQAIRAMLREHGGRAKSAYKASTLRPAIEDALAQLKAADGTDIREEVLPLLSVCESIRRYCETIDKRLLRVAQGHPVCNRFLGVPGVGPICALAFYSAVDEPGRFERVSDVAPFLGLTPRIRQSGKLTERPRISKMGNSPARAHLIQAAGVLMNVCRKESTLRTQALILKQRLGFGKASVAMARKLSIVMLSLWKSGEVFDSDRAIDRLGSRSRAAPV